VNYCAEVRNNVEECTSSIEGVEQWNNDMVVISTYTRIGE